MITALIIGGIVSTVMSLFTIGHCAIAIVSDNNLSKFFINKEVKSNSFVIGVLSIYFLNLIIGIVLNWVFYFVVTNSPNLNSDFYFYLIKILLSSLILFGGLLFSFLFKIFWKHIIPEVLIFISLYLWLMPKLTSLV